MRTPTRPPRGRRESRQKGRADLSVRAVTREELPTLLPDLFELKQVGNEWRLTPVRWGSPVEIVSIFGFPLAFILVVNPLMQSAASNGNPSVQLGQLVGWMLSVIVPLAIGFFHSYRLRICRARGDPLVYDTAAQSVVVNGKTIPVNAIARVTASVGSIRFVSGLNATSKPIVQLSLDYSTNDQANSVREIVATIDMSLLSRMIAVCERLSGLLNVPLERQSVLWIVRSTPK